jgi:hypothetical protein
LKNGRIVYGGQSSVMVVSQMGFEGNEYPILNKEDKSPRIKGSGGSKEFSQRSLNSYNFHVYNIVQTRPWTFSK